MAIRVGGVRWLTPLLLLLLAHSGWALNQAALNRCREHGGTVRLAQQPSGGHAPRGTPSGWAAARAHVRCSLLSGLNVDRSDDGPELREGDSVRVTSAVTFMHVPGHKGGFAAEGSVGTVTRIYTQPNLSPNRGIKVEFVEPKKWIGHFSAHELEVAPKE